MREATAERLAASVSNVEARCALQLMTRGSKALMPTGVYPLPGGCVMRAVQTKELKGVPEVALLFTGVAPCSDCKSTLGTNETVGLCYLCARESGVELGLRANSTVTQGPRRADRTNYTGCRLYGHVFPRTPMVMSAACVENEERSLVKRQCCSVPIPDDSLWDDLFAWVGLKSGVYNPLFGIVPRMRKGLDFSEWNEHFPKARRGEHERAYARYKDQVFTPEMVDKFCTIDTFVKREKINKSGLGEAQDYDPRAISSFKAVVTAFTGPTITAIQNWLHALWNGRDHPVIFAAGCSADDLSAWFSAQVAKGRKAFESDGGLYDSTIGARAHQFNYELYRMIGFEDEPHFFELRKRQSGEQPLRGRGKFGTRFSVQHTMKSGAADTCLGNTITNVILHLFALSRANGNASLQETLDHCSMAAMGDDNLGMVDVGWSTEGMKDTLFKLGLIPKFTELMDTDRVVFLNMRPYPISPGRCKFAPRIGRLLSRLGWACAEQRDPLAYVCGVARAFTQSCNHVPILSTFFEAQIRECRRADGKNHDRGLERTAAFRKQLGLEWKVMSLMGERSTPSTRAFVEKIYGLSQADIAKAEQSVDNIGRPPALVSDPILQRIIDLDS